MTMDRDWRTHFEDHYQSASQPELHIWQMPEEVSHPLLRYQCWFMKVCMTSVYLQGDYGAELRDRIANTDGYALNGLTYGTWSIKFSTNNFIFSTAFSKC